MNNMYFSKLTIVIPTHERHNYLKRSAEYWREFTGRIIIVDSSIDGLALGLSDRCDYIHVPGMGLFEKLSLAISKVETKYCALCADDDFHAFDALDRAVYFLDEHRDFASVQGHYISFRQNGGIRFFIGYPNIHGYAVEKEDPASRMIYVMRHYMHQIYAVHRTSSLALTADFSKDLNDYFIELHFALVGMMTGKHRVLPMFYSAREIVPASGGRTTPGWKEIIDSDQEGLSNWKAQLAQTFSKVTGQPLKSGLTAVDEALAVYEQIQLDRPKATPGWKEFVRPYVPDWIVEVRRGLVQLQPEHLCHPSRLWRADSRACYLRRHKNIPGYPWSDPDAKSAWAKMTSVIRQYGPLFGKD